MQERIQRVARMEEIYNKSCEAVAVLLQAAENYLAVETSLQELAAYYQSPLWLEDFDAERAAAFPKDMKRGILTEDAVYDLLTDVYRMKKLLDRLK